MDRPLLLAATIAALLLAGLPARAEDLVLDRFRGYLDALRVQAGIPGLSASIIGNNDIVWEGAFGRQDLERQFPTRADTPFQLDGMTQIFTASLVLRCVEEGRLSLDDRLEQFGPVSEETAGATLRQILSHTSSDALFRYRPERIASLAPVVTSCAAEPFRQKVAVGLEWLAMIDSVPGVDAAQLAPGASGIFSEATIGRYRAVVSRLASSYAVDSRGRASASIHPVTTFSPAGGLISTVRDIGQFVLALRKGLIVRPETLALAWRPAAAPDGQRLPHGLGWFVQSYNGEVVVWQYGVTEGASSSLLITVPGRGLSLVLLANSDGLSRPFPLAAGDVAVSPFANLFLGLFVR